MVGAGDAHKPYRAAVELSILGSFRIVSDGRPLPLPPHKHQSLLAYLALHPGPNSRERVAGLFWGDSTDEDARRSLRVALSALRKSFGDQVILADRDTVQIDPAFGLWVDALEFESEARAFLWAAAPDPSVLNLSIYQGDLLADFYDEWIFPERERLRGLHVKALHALVARLRALGNYQPAIDTARRLLTIDPADEEAHQHIIFCYLTLGDRSAAAEQYQACIRALREELGIEPSAATVELARLLIESPPARATAARRTNLPTPPTSFIGREEEVEEIISLVHQDRARLLTLTGAGGSGKTRLAIEAATELVEFYPDGVWWVELAALEEEELVPQAVSRSLGLVEASDRPPEELLVEYLTDKRLLVVEDNCEHLLAGCANLARRLLGYCPDVQILTTSREPLGAPGEQVWPVPTLACPDPAAARERNSGSGGVSAIKGEIKRRIPEHVAQSAAVTLFVQRAAAQRPGFRLTPDNASDIVQICCRLDGIPLALELAAARVRVLTPSQMAARLDKRLDLLSGGAGAALPRHQTLRATIDWSYDLLEPNERLLFRRLAAFAGGFTLEAVEAICADKDEGGRMKDEAQIHPSSFRLHPSDILNLLAHLVDKSLVQTREVGGEMHYEMLETIHAYARERLRETAEVAGVHSRHLAWYTRFVEQIEPEIDSPRQMERLDQLEREHDNIRTALRRSLNSDEAERLLGIRLTGALEYFWYCRNYAREAASWVERALAAMPSDAPLAIEARLYKTAGTTAWLHGDLERAARLHEKAVAAYRAAGDLAGTGVSLENLSVQFHMLGQFDRAVALSEEAVDVARQAGDRGLLAGLLAGLGWKYLERHDLTRAESPLREAVAFMRQTGGDYFLVNPLSNLAIVLQEKGQSDEASTLAAEALAVAQRLGDARILAVGWQTQGRVWQQQQQWAQAIIAYRESLALLASTTDRFNQIDTLEGLAVALVEHGRTALGITLLAGVAAQRRSLGYLSSPPYQARQQEAILARAPAEMSEAAFAAAWARGQAMTLEQSIALALESG